MTARDDYDRAAGLASQAREVVAGWRALMVAADNDALVPAYRALEAAQNLLDDESARLHVAVRVEPTDADRERVVREVRDRLAKAVERKPSAGWAAPDGRSIDRDEAFGWTLPIAAPPGGVGWSGSGRHRACVRDEEGSIVLRIQVRDVLGIRWVTIWDDVMGGTATDEANRLAAQLAAEDALLEIASVIVQAVRR